MDNGQEDIPSLGKDSHHCQARACIPIALGLVSRYTPRRKRRYFNHMQTAHRANEMVGIPSPSMVPKDSHHSSHPSPRPSRISTRAAGLGRWCTSIPIYASQTTSSARTSGSHDGSRRRGCRFTLPPSSILRRTLALTALSQLCSCTTCALHCCTTASLARSPMTAIHASAPLPVLHPHAMGMLIAIWPVLFVTSASFNFSVGESIATADHALCPAPLPLHYQAHPVDLHAEAHPFCVPLRSKTILLALRQRPCDV